MTLTEFLTARLDEDELFAKRAADFRWGPAHSQACDAMDWRGSEVVDPGDCTCGGPARALREVEAKRAIVAVAGRLGTVRVSGRDEPFPLAVTFSEGRVYASEESPRRDVTEAWQEWWAAQPKDYYDPATLRHLAAVYADHPDYREEWKP